MLEKKESEMVEFASPSRYFAIHYFLNLIEDKVVETEADTVNYLLHLYLFNFRIEELVQ
jgi:hypothetical protein